MTLIAVVCALVLAAIIAIRSLIAPLLLGACVAAMIRPTMTALRLRFRGPKTAAAAATVAVVLVVALPLAIIAIPVSAEIRTVLALLRAGKLASLAPLLGTLTQTGSEPKSIQSLVHALGPRIADALPALLGTASEVALGIFVFLLTLYYVLCDGERAMAFARRVSPLAHAHLDALMREFVSVGRGVLVSVGLTALVQGGVAGIAYFSVGLPGAALLTLITAIAALVPIGTVLVWGPVAALLFAQGKTVAGGVIVFTGVVVISGIDHFVRPHLTRLARTRLHPLLVFLGMFGGLASLGMWGLFAGPLLIALGVAALRLYDRDQQARVQMTAAGLASGPSIGEDAVDSIDDGIGQGETFASADAAAPAASGANAR